MMFWLGSLMSQVLQWTQFCALMTKRTSLADGSAAELPFAAFLDPFIDTGRAIAAGWPGKDIVFRSFLQFHVHHLKVDGLVFLMIGVRKKH